ncbi:hypothetical protein [Sediminibacillus massiliensis]|uniref:hypothetical protein n=1 Tax=Sediminibacillus massiliensis TaxID=1926277 RepID=UPI0009884D8B|nr:hypothetical protein [Sediminibacillus massiliensis]
MRQYAMLRILLACFFLYLAWPYIHEISGRLSSMFWAAWLVFFLLVAGSNFASLLRMVKPPVMEQDVQKRKEFGKN